ncbi:hypothetical protein BIV57_13915 [Mangrovactinospora gilvigrisea]|uniref:D-inositol 3-phosphate glycosyltransferase n=1 Tax=Mangrovactinospora gilvigrisea TaxID=1428644 RepID=A0A1J7BTU0_9ACTN|nr:glycosyltransferase [Mangrovactinospora gilvigrisea]OIV36857.1 hypothetical protein BIV57_13915 [Mangrovactinospora gilvigrisea]
MSATSVVDPGGGVDVSVVSSGHHVADARLHRHCAALRRAGLRVEVIARGGPEDAPAGVAFRPVRASGLARRGVNALRLPGLTRGRVVLTLDPDLVPGARLTRAARRGNLLVVDVHEDYLALLDDRDWARGPAGPPARLLARVATGLSRGADLTVVADQQVPPAVANRRLVIRNLPDFAMLPVPAPPGPVPRALYVGDVRASRGLFAMLGAVAAAPGWELDVVGPVHPRDRAAVQRWRTEDPAAARVRFHGRMPPERAWRLAAGAWTGLSLLEPTRAFRAAVPSKVYEYLACGLPVVTTDLPRAAELVRSTGAGAVVPDGSAEPAGRADVAEVLRHWAGPGRGDHVRARGAALSWSAGQRGAESPYDELAREVAWLMRHQGPPGGGPRWPARRGAARPGRRGRGSEKAKRGREEAEAR